MDAKRMLQRITICKIANHKWSLIAYPGGDPETSYFQRCLRCGKEYHGGTGLRPTFPGF